ncbi:MAG: tRNA (adenosine(37)-N6)-threonylcarbamoyltransferase complex transferase subunit TsaD [Deltaproteobacteria bacterium]|nr:tRNA (adenosine(37)-N6)-threonylcarbamoyltransferase complex transferase subunit TsaD [Deltaproteobacteria bacterium]
MIVLGLESSCDDTAAGIVEDGRERASIVSSQDQVHAPFGGVVPELAARNHIRHVVPVVQRALEQAGLALDDLDGVAATQGPGLVGCLLVGLSAAKAIARARGIPFVGVNHIEGHLLSIELDEPLARPFLGLVVSGGHTALYWAREDGSYALLGKTRDDAAGEAFDKAAKLLGLGYPGGREIERLSREGDPQRFRFARPRVRGAALDMSFSGLKTALRLTLEREPDAMPADVAASFQNAIVTTLVEVTRQALVATGARCVVVTGGVAANGPLREAMARMASEEGADLRVPALKRCTDNGSMIAYAGWRRLARGEADPLSLNARAELALGPRVEPEAIA